MHHSGLAVDLCRVLMRGRASSPVTLMFGLARLSGVSQASRAVTAKMLAGGGLPVTGVADYGGSMAGGNGNMHGRWQQLYARAEATRGQSRALAVRHWAAQRRAAELLQSAQAARDRAQQVHELWLAARSGANPLRYWAYARLQARLASMPGIEQAKGILMVQFGWPEDQSFDALRRVSQRGNIKVRDLAAEIVATAAQPGSAQSHARDRRQPSARRA